MSDPNRHRGLRAQFPEDDVVATPEGDNEYPPDVPVGPVEGLQVAGGNAPLPYDSDKPSRPHGSSRDSDRPGGNPPAAEDDKGEVEETVDKLSLGQILT